MVTSFYLKYVDNNDTVSYGCIGVATIRGKCNPHEKSSTNWNLTLHQTEISHCFIQLRKINGHIQSLILILCGYATAHTLG